MIHALKLLKLTKKITTTFDKAKRTFMPHESLKYFNTTSYCFVYSLQTIYQSLKNVFRGRQGRPSREKIRQRAQRNRERQPSRKTWKMKKAGDRAGAEKKWRQEMFREGELRERKSSRWKNSRKMKAKETRCPPAGL